MLCASVQGLAMGFLDTGGNCILFYFKHFHCSFFLSNINNYNFKNQKKKKSDANVYSW